MIGGRVRHWNIQDNPTGLDWREVEASSKISAFFIRWRLPPFYVDMVSGEVRGVPFFPLPYRLKGGGILFCSEGSGWYMRDEAIATKRWLEKFVELGLPGVEADGLPCDIAPDVAKKIAPCLGVKSLPRRAKDHGLNLLITEAAFFEADETQPRPYAFIPELYEERARLRREEPGNVAGQNIKLCLNSLSGKAAQSIGGSETDPPRTACPWYAAATTAGTRRRVMEAALQNPHDIVQFSTDGVVSGEPLDLDIGEGLGQWEAKRVKPGTPSVFLQSGLYTYRTEHEKLPTVKTRGMKRNYQTQEEWLLQRVPVEWSKPADPNDPKTWPVLDVEQKEFVTAGSAVSGRKRFEVIGRWAKRPRTINVHIPGLKRRLNALRPELYYRIEERPARRCFELVETLPAQNTGRRMPIMSPASPRGRNGWRPARLHSRTNLRRKRTWRPGRLSRRCKRHARARVVRSLRREPLTLELVPVLPCLDRSLVVAFGVSWLSRHRKFRVVDATKHKAGVVIFPKHPVFQMQGDPSKNRVEFSALEHRRPKILHLSIGRHDLPMVCQLVRQPRGIRRIEPGDLNRSGLW